MLDVVGRNIKTSKESDPEEGIHFELGSTTFLTHNGFLTNKSTEDAIQVDSPDLPKAVRPGDLVSFNDGGFGAVVIEVSEDSVKV